jgi:competence protein ComEC
VVKAQFSADWVLTLAIGSILGALAVVAPWEVACVFAIAALVFQPTRRLRMMVVGVVALLIGFARASHLESDVRAARARVTPHSVRCEGVATVVSSPVRGNGTYRWVGLFDARSCDADTEKIEKSRTAFYSARDDLARGDRVEIIAQIAPPERLYNRETGDPEPAEARRDVMRSGGAVSEKIIERGVGLWAWIDRARAHTRRRIDASFDPDIAPMARALVLGESDLSAEDDMAFRASGLAHLLAVSGAHLVIVVAGFVALLEALLARIASLSARVDVSRVAAVPGAIGACIYADFAGGSGSAWRAAWMLSFALLARVLGRRADSARAFSLSILAMTFVDPLVAFDISFALSAAATAGLFLFSARVTAFVRQLWPRMNLTLIRATSASFGASVACAPILARIAPSLPAGGLIANLLAVPVGETVALPLCLFHALLSPLPNAERGEAIVASGGLRIVLALARTFAKSAVEVPLFTSWQLVACGVGLVGVCVLAGTRRLFVVASCAAFFLLAEAQAVASGSPHGKLRVTFLDVGQGDSALVDFPDGRAMLIDGGGMVGSPVDVGARVLAPVLRARRRRKIDWVVLSHPHPDHFGGFVSGLQNKVIGEAWDTGQGERESVGGGYAQFFDRLKTQNVPIRSPQEICGDHFVGDVRVSVLAPCPGYDPDEPPNDNSLVLKITYGRRAFLFVGDAEHFEESTLLAHGDLRADVLKVGHHGSRTSSSAPFIAAVAPTEAVISVGSRNRFGHPNPATLATLSDAHIRAWRTDRDGEIEMETDGENLSISAARGPPDD